MKFRWLHCMKADTFFFAWFSVHAAAVWSWKMCCVGSDLLLLWRVRQHELFVCVYVLNKHESWWMAEAALKLCLCFAIRICKWAPTVYCLCHPSGQLQAKNSSRRNIIPSASRTARYAESNKQQLGLVCLKQNFKQKKKCIFCSGLCERMSFF